MQLAEVYISYAWGDGTVVGKRRQKVFDELLELLKKKNFNPVVDFEGIGYKDSIKNFMSTLGEAKYIVMIVSDKYLKSKSCMFEASKMLAHGEFKDRIFPLVLPDAKIYQPKGRSAYITYWDKQIQKQEGIINKLENKAYAKAEFEELDLYNEIRRIVDRFNSVVGDMNTMNLNYHQANDYMEIVKALEQKRNQGMGLCEPSQAYSVLQVTPRAFPSQVTTQYNKLVRENERGIAKAILPEIKKAHIEASQKLNAAYELVLPAAKKNFTQEKSKVKRLIRSNKHAEAKILLEQVLETEVHEAELHNLLLKCENALTLATNEENRKVGEKTSKAGQTARKAKEQAPKVARTARRESARKTSNSASKVVQTKKMPKKMQMQAKDPEEIKRKTLRRIIIPSALAVLAIIAGFVVKERVLQIHVEKVITKARNHINVGEISTAVRELEDASRDLIYEERLADELKNFRELKTQYGELLLKIRSYKKQKKWKLAERAMVRILQYTPRDSFMMYQLKDVRKELRVNDFNYWMLIAAEAMKQGESGYIRAKKALVKAEETKVGKKLIAANRQKVDSMIDIAFERRLAKLRIYVRESNSRTEAIEECQKALELKPNNPDVKAILKGLQSNK